MLVSNLNRTSMKYPSMVMSGGTINSKYDSIFMLDTFEINYKIKDLMLFENLFLLINVSLFF